MHFLRIRGDIKPAYFPDRPLLDIDYDFNGALIWDGEIWLDLNTVLGQRVLREIELV